VRSFSLERIAAYKGNYYGFNKQPLCRIAGMFTQPLQMAARVIYGTLHKRITDAGDGSGYSNE
jgi:hypothetical protein